MEINPTVSENYVLDRDYYVKYIAVPTFLETEWHTYNGTEQTYYLDYGNLADKDEIEITIPEEYKDKISYTDPQIKVKNAGKYKIELNIAKTDGSVRWASRDRETKTLEFEIKKSPIALEILGEDGGAGTAGTDHVNNIIQTDRKEYQTKSLVLFLCLKA